MVAKNYGSVEGEATIIDKKYAPADNLLSLSGEPVDYVLVKTFDGAKFWNYLKAHEDDYWNIFHTGYLANLQVNKTGGDNYNVEFSGFSGTYLKINGETTFDAFTLALYAGIGVDPTDLPDVTTDAITIYPSYGIAATSLNKLYGSAGGESRLIFQRIRRLKYATRPEFGIVYYKTNDSDPDSAIRSVELQSQAEFESLCGEQGSQTLTWSATIGAEQVTINSSGASNVIVGIEIGENITSIPNLFLAWCMNLVMDITIPSNVQSIGDFFMATCVNFSKDIFLQDGLLSIGVNFLANCANFNSDISLPQTLQSIGTNFMIYPKNMTSSIDVGSLSDSIIDTGDSFATLDTLFPCYATGITISGANRSAWLAKFPNSSTSPYRKLLDAGY